MRCYRGHPCSCFRLLDNQVQCGVKTSGIPCCKELLTRIRCKEDERVMWITLTEKGKQLEEKAKEIPLQLKGTIALSAQEFETLKALTYKILNKDK